MVKLPEKGDFYSKIGLVNCCCYMQLHMVLGETKEYASLVNLLITYKEALWHDLPKLQGNEKCTGVLENHLIISLFFFVLFSRFYGNQLGRKYA